MMKVINAVKSSLALQIVGFKNSEDIWFASSCRLPSFLLLGLVTIALTASYLVGLVSLLHLWAATWCSKPEERNKELKPSGLLLEQRRQPKKPSGHSSTQLAKLRKLEAFKIKEATGVE